ncbi:alpha-mannosidase [Paenibacillus albidus]|uniref:alpha-mannosidase n=1 Tax=Paenibacillus albidus TaxID=2041023 RepID=UPI001BE822B5|nr:alpha-mannosidase [Paenibacillus albidus]MBT2291230.1 alpha-mannosidase [Paenibacillus albidus]
MTTKKTAHIISHTHWDREWYMPYEYHHHLLIELMDKLLDTLDNDPGYRYFHLDGHTIIREDYLQIRPDQRDRLDHYIREGRIHFGPWYVLQDEFLTSSEANIRNLLIGHLDAKPFGRISKTGYFPDSFGNMGQAPQILRQAGITNAVFGRGVKPTGFNNTVGEMDSYKSPYSEMIWRSPDGSEVLGVLFANWYCNGMEVPVDPAAAKAYWDKNLADAEKFASTPHLLFMNGCDHQPIQTDLSEAIQTASNLYPDIEFVHSNFDKYLQALEQTVPENLVTIEGELRSQHTDGWGTLVNTASSRVYLKQLNQAGQTLLEKVAEPLAAFAQLAGVQAYPHHLMTYAWKTLMQNHPHDSICGCSVDEVHREMVTRFAKSSQMSQAIVTQSATALSEAIDLSQAAWREGAVPFTVFNTSGWSRSGTVSVELITAKKYFPEGPTPQALAKELGMQALGTLQVMDEEGKVYPAKVEDLGVHFGYELPKDRFRQPYMARKVKITFFANDVAALGYRTYALVASASDADEVVLDVVNVQGNTMENAKLKVSVESNGSVTVYDKVTGITFAGLNVFENTGDIGNEYVYRQPGGEAALTTEGLMADIMLVEQSSSRAVFEAVLKWEVPASADETFITEKQEMVPFTERKAKRTAQMVPLVLTTQYTLEAGSGMLQVKTSFNNAAKDHRLRALFPTGLISDSHYVDSIFEVAKRNNKPAEEWINPSNTQHQQVFVTVTDGVNGLLVANKGLNEYEVLLDEKNTIAVTLLRASSELGDWGVFETPEAQCLGEQSVEYTIIPYAGDGAVSGAYAQAYQYQIPWTVVQTKEPASQIVKTSYKQDEPGVKLPLAGQFINWNSDSSPLAFSTLKFAEETGDLVARWYNLSSETANLKVNPSFTVQAAYESDILERRISELNSEDQEVAGYKIVTRAYQVGS